ncbi:MAG: hypothetical protein K2N54_06530 [Helicobacter sp.]|nr:hypothetical protein [Helicobacter sp.]
MRLDSVDVYAALHGAKKEAKNLADSSDFAHIDFATSLQDMTQQNVESYQQYLRGKYGNVRFESVGKDRTSLENIGKSMSGNDVVIAPNIVEQMANDPQKAAYYERKIDAFFESIPMENAYFAARGLVNEPAGVVVHDDGSVTYIGGCSDSPERVAQVQRENKEKQEKKEALRRENEEAANMMFAKQTHEAQMSEKQKAMADFLANRADVVYMGTKENAAIAAYMLR